MYDSLDFYFFNIIFQALFLVNSLTYITCSVTRMSLHIPIKVTLLITSLSRLKNKIVFAIFLFLQYNIMHLIFD